MPEIATVSNRHEAIMTYMVANPGVKLGDVAAHFGYTQAWLSCIIHSDAFQRQLRERQDTVFNHTVLPLSDKMAAVANLALDRLIEQVPVEVDIGDVRETAEAMLDRIGFSPKGAPSLPPAVMVQVNIEKERLASARARIGRAAEPAQLEGEFHEVLPAALPEPDRVGGVQNGRSLPREQGIDPGAEAGASL